MKVRCIKEYRYTKSDALGRLESKCINKGEEFDTCDGINSSSIYNKEGRYVISLDDNQFDRYFEIIAEDEKVDHPDHYNQGEMETIDVIEYVLSDINGKYAFALGNIIKYVVRANMKGGKEDLDKAKWYIERIIGGKNV